MQAANLEIPGGDPQAGPTSVGATSLSELMWQPIGVSRASAIVREILIALGELHERGAVHGHLHPGLIQLRQRAEGGELAVLLPPETIVCSLENAESHAAYRAPEQLEGAPASVVGDLHAVGVILYEMLTGHAPSLFEVFAERLQQTLQAPSPRRNTILDPFVVGLTRPRPEERLPTVRAALGELDRCLAGPESSVAAVPTPPSAPVGSLSASTSTLPAAEPSEVIPLPTTGRTKWWVAAAMVLGVAGLGSAWSLRSQPTADTPVVQASMAGLAPASIEASLPVAADLASATPAAADAPPARRARHEAVGGAPEPAAGAAARARKQSPPDRERRKARRASQEAEPEERRLAAPSVEPIDRSVAPTQSAPAKATSESTRGPKRRRSTVMSAEEAEAWSRMRAGTPRLSFRKPKQAREGAAHD